MNAKEYLKQVKNVDNLLRSIATQIEKNRSLATYTSPALNPSGSHSSADPTKGSKLENMAIDIMDLEEQKQKQAARLKEIKKDVTETINSINNLSVQFILEERYLLYRSWDSIAEETGFSKSYLFHMHSTGLQLVESIINR